MPKKIDKLIGRKWDTFEYLFCYLVAKPTIAIYITSESLYAQHCKCEQPRASGSVSTFKKVRYLEHRLGN